MSILGSAQVTNTAHENDQHTSCEIANKQENCKKNQKAQVAKAFGEKKKQKIILREKVKTA